MLLISGFRKHRLLTTLCLAALAAMGMLTGCAKSDESANSFLSDLTRDMQSVENWLRANNQYDEYKTHPSGIIYKIIDKGDYSDTISLEEIPVVTYSRSVFPSTAVVESSPLPTSFDNRKLKDHIPGWQLGLQLISKGGRIKMFIPSRLAFANVGIPGRIPPNAILVCDVTLIDIRK